jgi:hypothetical protein
MSEGKMMIGIHEPKPARNFPPGRVRWLMRYDDYVKAAVRTPEGVRIFVVRDMGDAWEPMPNCEQASKTRADYGPADMSPAGMVTLPVADFLEMAREMDRLRRKVSSFEKGEICPACFGLSMIPGSGPDADVMNTPCPECNPRLSDGSVPSVLRAAQEI